MENVIVAQRLEHGYLQVRGGIRDKRRDNEHVRVALEHLLRWVDEIESDVVVVGNLLDGDLRLANPDVRLVAKLGTRCDVVLLVVIDLVCHNGLKHSVGGGEGAVNACQ